jgi:phage FluMu protein gp41
MMGQQYPVGSGALKTGLKIGDEIHRDFVIRPGNMGDYFAAEDVTPIDKSLQFDAALLCQRITRIGTFTGALTLNMLGNLTPADFSILRRKMAEMDAAGESKSATEPTG